VSAHPSRLASAWRAFLVKVRGAGENAPAAFSDVITPAYNIPLGVPVNMNGAMVAAAASSWIVLYTVPQEEWWERLWTIQVERGGGDRVLDQWGVGDPTGTLMFFEDVFSEANQRRYVFPAGARLEPGWTIQGHFTGAGGSDGIWHVMLYGEFIDATLSGV
jgi:hypothetical protein